MKFNEFIQNTLGKTIDTDGAYGGQCMDLYNYYVNNVIGVMNVGSNYAKNIIYNENVKKNFKIIKNYGDYIPPKGAVAVWQGWTYGHVGVVESAEFMKFTCIEQNWNGVQKVQRITHNYKDGVPLYFLEPYNRANIDEPKSNSYLVKIDVEALNIRAGAGINNKITGCIRDKGIYTIVETAGNWGKLKSGKGWICLDYTKRV